MRQHIHTHISYHLSLGDMDILESAHIRELTLPSTSTITQSILLHGLVAHLAAVEALQSWELSKAIWDLPTPSDTLPMLTQTSGLPHCHLSAAQHNRGLLPPCGSTLSCLLSFQIQSQFDC